jgi:hypothetical protein
MTHELIPPMLPLRTYPRWSLPALVVAGGAALCGFLHRQISYRHTRKAYGRTVSQFWPGTQGRASLRLRPRSRFGSQPGSRCWAGNLPHHRQTEAHRPSIRRDLGSAPMPRGAMFRTIGRGNHSFHATGITAYLKRWDGREVGFDGELSQHPHQRSFTTGFDEVTLDEVDRAFDIGKRRWRQKKKPFRTIRMS